MSTPSVIYDEYDIVIAGGEPSSTSCSFYLLSFRLPCPTVTGGTAACVVAGRLAAADVNLRILLLEAGPTTYNDPAHTEPLQFINHLAPGSRAVRTHVSEPSAALGGRTPTVPCGQCFGGGGSVNCTPRVSLCTFSHLIDLDAHLALVNYSVLISGRYDVHSPVCL